LHRAAGTTFAPVVVLSLGQSLLLVDENFHEEIRRAVTEHRSVGYGGCAHLRKEPKEIEVRS